VSEVSELNWYVVATKARCEKIARENLERQGFQVMLPEIKINKRQRGARREVKEPMFPSYVFVSLVLGRDDSAPIRSTVGCVGIVRFGLRPQALPRHVVSTLLEMGENPIEYRKSIRPGDKVLFEEGPFMGLEAIYSLSKGSDRVEVLLSFLGRENIVTANSSQVSKLS
jgi:transcriptional antiterminator RfaH